MDNGWMGSRALKSWKAPVSPPLTIQAYAAPPASEMRVSMNYGDYEVPYGSPIATAYKLWPDNNSPTMKAWLDREFAREAQDGFDFKLDPSLP